MVEKVPDSTYEMVGGLDKQIKEIKEVIELRKYFHLHTQLYIQLSLIRAYSRKAPRTLRRAGYCPAKRCSTLRSTRNRQDPPRKSSSASYRLQVHPSLGIRARPEVYRRGIPYGQRIVRDGPRACT